MTRAVDSMRRRCLLAAAALGAGRAAGAAVAFPTRPVQLIHGFGPGGNADVVSRLIARQLQLQFQQPVVVDIKSGAGGQIATQAVAKAAPDGYTLVMLTGAHTVSAALRRLPFDPVHDFAFISTVTRFPFVIAVRQDHPARTLAELLQQARQQQVSFSSVGVGSTQHLCGELLASVAGVPMLHVPYRGGGAPIQALIGGEVDVLIDTLTVAGPHLRSGRVRALAITSAAPWPAWNTIAPVAATLPGFEVLSWLGLAAPAGTPGAVVARLNAAVRQALQDPGVRQTLADAGSMAVPSTPQAMLAMVESDLARWRAVAARRGIRIE